MLIVMLTNSIVLVPNYNNNDNLHYLITIRVCKNKEIFAKMMILIVTTHSLVLTADDKKTITEDNVALL